MSEMIPVAGLRVALCLNSSFLGFFAHAGFLRGLLEIGVRPSVISGASAGALVAGLFAAGHSPDEILALFLSPKLRAVFREPGALWRGVATILNLPGQTGAIRGTRALALLRAEIGTRQIEDCRAAKLSLSVTNLSQGRAELLTRGPLAESILASGALPGFFAAREVGDDWFWDGGVANPLPFDQWLNDPEIDAIIVHRVTPLADGEALRNARPRSMSAAVNVSHRIIADELLRLKIDLARHAGKRLLLLRTPAPRPSLWDPARIGAECVICGTATAREHCAELAELVS